MKNDNLLFQLLFPAILLVALLLIFSCNHYPAQKKPWPVGTTPLYFNDITPDKSFVPVDYTPPLTILSYRFDDVGTYDGNYHWFYVVKDATGKQFPHVIDYQLKK